MDEPPSAETMSVFPSRSKSPMARAVDPAARVAWADSANVPLVLVNSVAVPSDEPTTRPGVAAPVRLAATKLVGIPGAVSWIFGPAEKFPLALPSSSERSLVVIVVPELLALIVLVTARSRRLIVVEMGRRDGGGMRV